MGLLLGIPAAVALYVLALPLISTIFLHGALTSLDARMAALSLQAFAVGVLPLVLVKVAAPAYFAQQDTSTPFRYACAAVVTNIALNLALFWWFGHVGLALATSASAWVNAMLLLRGVVARALYQPTPQLRRTGVRVSVAALAMGLALWALLPEGMQWLQMSAMARAFWLLAAVVGGSGVYLLVLVVLGERPKSLLHRV